MSHTLSACPKCHSLNKVSAEEAQKKAPTCGKCGADLDMHGLVSSVNTDDFKRIIAKSDRPVVVDFWASWCGPCRMYGPEFEKASLRNTNTVFLKVNTETEQLLSQQLGIRGIPCTVVFNGGKETKRQAGAMLGNQLDQFLKS